ncbi:hypothetical protein CsSME_00043317 [Camellia sinensis var. sinensis]|uniref:Bet v I/Major latex protein domain-containing protein n=1 Tax=Camellia sinensis var. sinensis TaxID=542762 RepID=A0A4S4D1J0_CAMSN|nr:MLP-like protein 31 [Camellia sinensis]THF94955.1 hypothetical protein TEA_010835 [Camellia sinensis var. sinensis]
MSLVGKLEAEVEIQSSADKFYHIFRSRAHHIPNICPEKVSGIDVHEGDWENVGSIKKWNYVLDKNAESLKETVESIDDENKVVTFNVVEGEIMQCYKSFKSILQVIEKGEGALVKWTIEYEKVNENAPTPDKYLDFGVGVTKDIDAHLVKA